MDTLEVDLEFCYGIKKLHHTFDFSQHRAHVIYAPNGSMKSSFARVFEDRIKTTKSSDLLNPDNTTKCVLKDQNGSEIIGENILVIGSSNPRHDSRKEQASLLVNADLKNEYSELLDTTEKSKKEFIKKISTYSGSPKKIEELLTSAFGKGVKNFFECLELVKDRVNDNDIVDYSEIKYDEIINEKVLGFLKTEAVSTQIENYVAEYNKLIDQSRFFKRGAFDHTNASVICESLNKNGFFKAEHSIFLNETNGDGQRIASYEEMEKTFKEEKERILADKQLEKKFDELDSIISNAQLRTFRSLVEKRKEIIPRLENIENFKKDLWISYLAKEKELFNSLLTLHKGTANRLKEIEGEAAKEFTIWQEVVRIFKERFDVPFTIRVSNQDDVILRGEAPQISFTHIGAKVGSNVDNETLLKVLSTGEMRALYILNVIFEIKSREKNANTLIIIDDIADSFDYKNKYAIVEYLHDILQEPNFRAIILTHNFDFFRTLESRLAVSRYDSCHIIMKTDNGIKLLRAKDCLDIFIEWKKEVKKDICPDRNKILIAAIPFVRNLIEYTHGKIPEYETLTHLMHIKPDSELITIQNLKEIYNNLWIAEIPLASIDSASVIDTIFLLAEDCMNAPEGINLENKIILSIAIRLRAEKFIIQALNDPNYVLSLGNNQTAKLIGKYKQTIGGEKSYILDKVNIMTPENIHFNSFMYEPILDMSDTHLKTLYNNVKSL